MTIELNNEREEYPGNAALSVRQVLAAKGWSFPLIIVRINGKLAERDDWDSILVRDGDSVEAFHMVSGG